MLRFVWINIVHVATIQLIVEEEIFYTVALLITRKTLQKVRKGTFISFKNTALEKRFFIPVCNPLLPVIATGAKLSSKNLDI